MSSFDMPFNPPPPRPKFQQRYWIHILLFLLTMGSTWYTGGWWYSIPFLLILGAHEFGHYLTCKRYNVDATLPFFLPMPLIPSGSVGAVIRIREPFPSKRALFDIGVAGPIAGFVALVPVLWLGILLSTVGPRPTEGYEFGEPLLFKALAYLHFGSIPDGYEVMLHPAGFAAWWGMLATALNLLPFGQFDGGHLTYALLGRRSAYVSIAVILAIILLTKATLGFVTLAALMVMMAFLFGIQHPRVPDEHVPLDPGRRLVAVLALVMFVLCFTPFPVELIGR
jgi:membrane-associated protease RseP (regulator of RpoE activity)